MVTMVILPQRLQGRLTSAVSLLENVMQKLMVSDCCCEA
jgi:hypothetical protein